MVASFNSEPVMRRGKSKSRPKLSSVAVSIALLCYLKGSSGDNVEKDVVILTDKTVNATIQKPGRSLLLVRSRSKEQECLCIELAKDTYDL